MEYAYDDQGRLLASSGTGQGSAKVQGATRYTYDDYGRLSKVEQDLVSNTGETVTRLVERREYAGLSQRPRRISQPSINAEGTRTTHITYNESGLPIQLTERGYAPILSADAASLPSDQISATGQDVIERTITLSWSGRRLIAVDGPRTDAELGQCEPVGPRSSAVVARIEYPALRCAGARRAVATR